MTKTQQLLETYLNCLGLDYTLKVSENGESLILNIIVPKHNNEKIGILKGKKGQNIINIRRVLKVVSSLEGKNPLIVIKLVD